MFLKIKSSLIYVLLSITFVLGACGEKQYTDVEHLNRAMDFYDHKQLPAAVIELKNALAKNAENGEARWLLGKLYVELGGGAEAEKELNKAIDLGLKDPRILLKLYESYLLQGKYQEVVDSLAESNFSEEQVAAEAYILLGQANLGLGNLDEAHNWFVRANEKGQKINAMIGFARIATLKRDFDQAAQLIMDVIADSPENVEANYLAGQIYTFKEEYAKALEHFNLVVDKRPYDMSFRLGRAEVLILLNELDNAESDAQFVLKKNESDPRAHFVMAKVFYSRDELVRTQESLDKVLRGLPNHLPSFYMLGIVHFRQGHLEQSEYYLDRFLSFVKGSPDAEKLLVENYIKMGRPAEAVPLLERLKSQKGEPDLFIMTALGEAYLYTGEIEKAIDIYTEAVKLWPTESFLEGRLAVAYLNAGDKDAAIQKLRPLTDVSDAGRAHILLINAYIEKGDESSALEFSENLVKKNADSGSSHFIQGYTLARTGAFDKAITAYERSIQINPSYTPSILGLAEIYVFRKQLDLAIKTYQKVLAIDGDHFSSFLGLAKIEHHLNNFESARNWYAKAAQVEPKNIEPIKGLVKIDILEGHSLQALKMSREFTDNWPENAEGLTLMAISLIANKEDARAETYLRRYLEKMPNDTSYRTLLSELLLELGDVEGALEETSAILNIMPEHKPSLLRKIKLLVSMQRFGDARAEIGKLKAMTIGWNLDRMLADTYAAEGRVSDSITAYKAAYVIEPTRNVLKLLVDAFLKNGDSDRAVEALDKYLIANPGDTAVRLGLANLFAERGESREAIESYQAVLINEPDSIVALNNLAWLKLESDNDPESALGYAAQAYKAAADVPGVQDTYAWVLLKNGKYERALELYEALFEREPQNAEYVYHYVVALLGVGDVKRGAELRQHLKTLKGGDVYVKALESK